MAREPRKRIHAPTVSTIPILEVMACKLSSIETVPPMEREKMIKRAVKAGIKSINSEIESILEHLTEIASEHLVEREWMKTYSGKSINQQYADMEATILKAKDLLSILKPDED